MNEERANWKKVFADLDSDGPDFKTEIWHSELKEIQEEIDEEKLELQNEINKLKSELEKEKEVVDFYSSAKRYRGYFSNKSGEEIYYEGPISEDQGKKARERQKERKND